MLFIRNMLKTCKYRKMQVKEWNKNSSEHLLKKRDVTIVIFDKETLR